MHTSHAKAIAGIVEAAPSVNNSSIRYSKLYNFESSGLRSTAVSIKYVMKGTEYYETTGETFSVNKCQYLLINKNEAYNVFVKSSEAVEGLCIDIDSCLWPQVLYADFHNDDYLLANPGGSNNVCTDVVEGVYNDNQNCFDRTLQSLASKTMLNRGRLETFTEKDYYTLTASLACAQQEIKKKITCISAKKPAVQKELYKRVSAARNYINDTFTSSHSIQELAQFALLSPFHFIRTFKQVYGCSPYQYILEQRLQYAYQLLKNRALPVAEVSDVCGFTDLFNFSKAFKRKFGMAPSYIDLHHK
jgi:AraC-like DNA-binding protein